MADPNVFGPDPTIFEVPSSPPEEFPPTPAGDAPTPLFAPGPSQFSYDTPTPAPFDNGDADDAMDVEDALLASPNTESPALGVQDVKPTVPEVMKTPAKTDTRSSSPMVIDSPDSDAGKKDSLAPPDLVVISATPGNSQASRAPSSSPPGSPGRQLSVPGGPAQAATTSSTDPAPKVSDTTTKPMPAVTPSTTVQATPAADKPSEPPAVIQPPQKPADKLPPAKRPRYEQPKRIVTIDTPVDTNRFKSLKNMSFKKNPTATTATVSSTAPPPPEPVPSGPQAGVGTGTNLRSWQPAPAPPFGLRQVGTAPSQPAPVHRLPARPQVTTAADNIHPSRRPNVPTAPAPRTGIHSYGTGNGSPLPGANGGRSPYGNRSPYGGNRSPLEGNRSPVATNGNKSPVWAGGGGVSPIMPQGGTSPLYNIPQTGQPSQAGYQQFQQPPAFMPPIHQQMAQIPTAVYEAQKDPRRRARQAQTAIASPVPSAAAPKPICSAQVCFPDQRNVVRPLAVNLLAGATKNPHGHYLLSKLPELSKLPDRQEQGPPQFTAMDCRCLDLLLNQGGSISEWCMAGPSANNSAEQVAIWNFAAGYMAARGKAFVASDELVPTWPINTRDFIMFCEASRVDVSKLQGSVQPQKNQILALVLSIPLNSHPVRSLPNPVRPDFTVGEIKSTVPPELPFRPQNLADSYGIDGDGLGKLKGSIQVYPSVRNELYRDTLANIKKAGLKPPAGSEAGSNILLFNAHWGQIVRSGSVAKGMEDNSKFYIAGPDLTLPADQWLLHPIWETGGLVTFSPTLILSDPVKFKETLDFIANVKGWVAYVHPSTVMWCQESWGNKARCPNPSVAFETFVSSLFTEDKVRKLAGTLPPDAGGLAVSHAPPSLPRKGDCNKWLSWLRKVFESSNYEELVPLCKEAHTAQQAMMYPNLGENDAMRLSTVEEIGLRDLIAMRERPDLLPYRRYIYVGGLSKSPPDLIRSVSFKGKAELINPQVQHVQVDNFAAVLSGAV